MEFILQFLNMIYSMPIAFYSVPFSVFFVMVFLSALGLVADIDIDFDIDPSGAVQTMFSHFKIEKVPIFLFLFMTFLIGTLILVIVSDVTSDITKSSLILNVVAILNIYIAPKIAGISLVHIVPLLSQKSVVVEYVGREAIVCSYSVTKDEGLVSCEIEGSKHQLNAKIEDVDNGFIELKKGTKVLVLSKIENKDCYIVEKS